ncbi:MAG: MFS family permease [Saprospiraceae bacterium]|jgi:MFS family permease
MSKLIFALNYTLLEQILSPFLWILSSVKEGCNYKSSFQAKNMNDYFRTEIELHHSILGAMSHRWALNMFFFVNGLIFANWATRLPQLQTGYDLEHDTLGFILLSHAIGAFIAMPITGWLIGNYGSIKITILSGMLFPLFFVIIPWMPSYYFLFLPFLFMGAATGVMDVAMNAQAVLVEKQLGKPVMTMFHALFSIGMVVGGLCGGYFATQNIGLKEHFGIIMIIGLPILLFTGRYLYRDQPDVKPEKVRFVLPKGVIVGLGVIAFCCMMGEGAMSDWSTLYMKDVVQAPLSWQTFGLTGFAAAMTVGRLFGDNGRIIIGNRKMMIYGAILSLFGMGFILYGTSPVLVIVGFAGVGLGLSNIVPIVYSLAGTTPGIPSGEGIAMATTIGYSGFMFGPPLIGWVADISSLWYSLAMLTGLFGVMMVLVLRYRSV